MFFSLQAAYKMEFLISPKNGRQLLIGNQVASPQGVGDGGGLVPNICNLTLRLWRCMERIELTWSSSPPTVAPWRRPYGLYTDKNQSIWLSDS